MDLVNDYEVPWNSPKFKLQNWNSTKYNIAINLQNYIYKLGSILTRTKPTKKPPTAIKKTLDALGT